ncbi:S8 family serine peptidase [Paenibacillus phocaensis]|uniref:S8 family serine peptidase n=1 Tax=Paenibacillus phocaensis TaxID=1776378 RepID=UPI0003A921EA|nr:DUF1611 domain-containing protein [Paenibacillus phocaensis]
MNSELNWITNDGERIKILLIDSGVNYDHPLFKETLIDGISMNFQEDGGICISNDCMDEIGHGTAIYYILKKNAPKSEVFVVKLFNNQVTTLASNLVAALRYIYDNIPCNIIHLSSGVVLCSELQELRDICDKFMERGVIIVSAFDNNGAISYPAAFPSVIGVDTSISCKKITDYEYIESETLNIRAVGVVQRLPWLEPIYLEVNGASFAAPYITCMISKIMQNGINKIEDILSELKKNASKIHSKVDFIDRISCFSFQKAAIFPLNKEVHCILRFKDLLGFEITAVYDEKYLGNIGKKVSFFTNSLNDATDVYIEDINLINWNKFDTFILGHTRELADALGKDIKLEVLNQCYMNKKNVYSFDDLSNYQEIIGKFHKDGLQLFFPYFKKENLPSNLFNKLRKFSIPVIGVFGTSSKQGKFTLQLLLRKYFLERKYVVGQFGTEPSSPLFGMDEVYPIGYDSTVDVKSWESVAAINYLMGKIENKKPDIIIIGSQSQTIPSFGGNLGFYPLPQHELILGSEPDVFILCVNTFDDLDYIKRTINYLESILPSKVIAIVLSHLKRKIYWNTLGSDIAVVDKAELEKTREYLKNNLNRPVFVLNSATDIESLGDLCVDFFAVD